MKITFISSFAMALPTPYILLFVTYQGAFLIIYSHSPFLTQLSTLGTSVILL